MRAEDLFLRFQQTREPAHLGAVFDLVADDLFAVALHLCRSDAEADDLVQATFLVAIERANRFDAARPLRPWLLGILQQEAKVQRRRARRAPDPARLPVAQEPPPVQIVLAAEAAAEVAAAIAQVPQPYRDVLELRLVQSQEHGEIAARLGRSPGAVRTQLWRGLELLRQLLPKGLALALAAQLSLRPGLAAVKQKVMAAASGKTVVVGAGTAVLAGAWIMQKVWIGVAAVVLMVGGWMAWPHDPSAGTTAPVGAPPSPLVTTAGVPTAEATPEPAADRTLVATAPTANVTAEAALPQPPVAVQALVVGPNGDAVADAEVAIYEAKPAVDKKGQQVPAYVRLPKPPLLLLHTDSTGRVAFTIDCERFVAARKAPLGITGDIRIAPDMRELRDELRLVLRPSLRVTGSVLMPDGSPARGARVECMNLGEQSWHLPPAAVTGDDGRFAFELVAEPAYCLYSFLAHLGPHHAPGVQIRADELSDRDLTLRFPGAYSVRGVLRDADGAPTAGLIRLLSVPTADAPSQWKQGRAKASGEFELLLDKGGSFELFGGIEGKNGVHLPVVLDDANPHQVVTLRLPRLVDAVITGRVVDERGEPCSGVRVTVSQIAVDPVWMQHGMSDLRPTYGSRVDTRADGSFQFTVPGLQRYYLGFMATKELWVRGPELTPPAADVVLVLRASDRQGFVLAGRAVAAATGEVVPSCRVFLVEHQEGGGSSDRPVATTTDGTFAVGPFPTGKRYSLRIEAGGFGDADLGPFDATVRREEVTARLQALGSVLVTVLRADGTPAVKAHVGLDRQGSHPFEPAHQGDTDAQGCVRIADLTADRYTLFADAEVASAGKAETEVVVRSGQETTVQVTLRQ